MPTGTRCERTASTLGLSPSRRSLTAPLGLELPAPDRLFHPPRPKVECFGVGMAFSTLDRSLNQKAAWRDSQGVVRRCPQCSSVKPFGFTSDSLSLQSQLSVFPGGVNGCSINLSSRSFIERFTASAIALTTFTMLRLRQPSLPSSSCILVNASMT